MAVSAPSSDRARESRRNRGRSETPATGKPETSEAPGPKTPPVGSDRINLSKPETGRSTLGGLIDGLADWAGFGGGSEAAPETGPENPTPNMELGENELLGQGRNSDHEKVTQLQEILREQGMDIEVDGLFGPQTRGAVEDFQRRHNLQVDGIVGPETLGAINSLERGETPQPGPTVETPQPDPTVETPQPDPTVETPQPGPAGDAATLQGIPPRAEDAVGGREFMESIQNLPPGAERDRAILNEILSGNIPDASRMLREVNVERDGVQLSYHAMPDYLSIGSNSDNVRVPMTPGVAQAIADRTGTSLPTTMMVDDIHNQSTQLHMPTFGSNRESISTYLSHDQRVDGLLGTGEAQTDFVSGHKKDLVIPHRDGRVAIYGGRWANGTQIQDYSNVHHQGYEDYSHGARLVSQEVTIDGERMNLADVLADPELADLFTHPPSISNPQWSY